MSGCLTLAINKGRDYLTLLAAVVVPALKTIQPFKVLGCKQRIGSIPSSGSESDPYLTMDLESYPSLRLSRA